MGETFCLGASVEPGILSRFVLPRVHLSVLVRASAGQQKWARPEKADSSQRIWENFPNHRGVVDITDFWGRVACHVEEETDCQSQFWEVEWSGWRFPMPGPSSSGREEAGDSDVLTEECWKGAWEADF